MGKKQIKQNVLARCRVERNTTQIMMHCALDNDRRKQFKHNVKKRWNIY